MSSEAEVGTREGCVVAAAVVALEEIEQHGVADIMRNAREIRMAARRGSALSQRSNRNTTTPHSQNSTRRTKRRNPTCRNVGPYLRTLSRNLLLCLFATVGGSRTMERRLSFSSINVKRPLFHTEASFSNDEKEDDILPSVPLSLPRPLYHRPIV